VDAFAEASPAGLTYAQNPCCGAARTAGPFQPRYKTHSARKLLILKELGNCHFCGQVKEMPDFSGLGAHVRGAIPKVIHRKRGSAAKRFKFKDLAATSRHRLNFAG
jgi:hypothetical protein